MKQNLLKISRLFMLLAIGVLAYSTSFAQSLTIRGIVLDETNHPLPGVSVQIKGTTFGTVTGTEGRFTLAVEKGKVLTFKFIGYTPQEVTIGNETNISVQLKSDSKALSEVVVTAYGVKKETRRLGYTVQEVKGPELVKARDPNPINSLAGKVAGLTVGTNAEMLGRPEIVLRGSKDLLFVVDGSPINSDTWNISPDDIDTYTVLKGPNAAALYGSRGINGAIIITTKKGTTDKKGWEVNVNSSTLFEGGLIASPEAQTEYGRGNAYHYEYQAKDNSNVYVPSADVLYDNANRLGEYGPRFEGQLLRQYDSPYDPVTGKRTPTPWTARGKNNFDNFRQTGLISTNNLAVAASGSNYNTRFSYTHMYQKGMFPNTKLNSDNFSLNASYNITPKLTIDGNINFNKQYTPNIPDVSYGPNSYIYMFKVYGSADYDVRDLEDIYKGPMGVPDLVQYAQEYGRLNNPWFMAKKWLRGHDKTDIYAYLRLNYKITNDLNVSLRSQISTWNQERTEQVPSSANLNAYTKWYYFGWYGDYRQDDRKLFENNTDLQINYNKTFGKFNVTGLLGGNSRSFTYNSFYGTTRALAGPNAYILSNSQQLALTYNWDSKMQVYSGYYSFDIGYDKYLNVNTTGRVDKLSTFAPGHDKFFYPSVSLSTAVSDYVKLPEAISFLKFRASEAVLKAGLTQSTVASAYTQVQNTPGVTTNTLLGYGTELYSSYDGPSYGNQDLASYTSLYNNTPSVVYSNTKANPNLHSLKRVSYEAGMDVKFLKNRLGLDVTYFDTQNGPQIYPFPTDPATGYNANNQNAVTTKRAGWEISLSGSPFRNKDGFSWDVNVNYSTFKETLKDIGYNNVQSIALVANHNFAIGDRVDEVFGTKFLRDPAGNIIYDAGGALLKASGSNSQVYGSLGHLNPDFTFGVNNRFSYKNFSFSFQFDGRIGGVIYDYNYYAARQGGTDLSTVQGVIGAARLAEWNSTKVGTQAPTPSLLGNEQGAGVKIVSGTPKFQNGVISNLSELTFAPNTTPITVQGYLNGNVKSIDEAFMISRSFAKLREVTIGYNVPAKYLRNSAIKAISFSLVGRNLLYFAARKDFDIDQYASGYNSADGTTGGAPSNGALQSTTARRYGFNLNVTF
ncbi:TonB-linked SusC/RagA family outer membrane protein [Mucilaginibacter oryzae]|uniref:TonB-linked SusC/RagA family outer membrane protein n=1 Tax=Mucilaginibacter oryzae TaxID=468058 RepID=A0A316HE40_9SPHI|nr:SusC/RagA family TonB-linked outer membrane protein [Mucilaginibacter oryzae]PWK78301.1 TonB-linked SusC/RagA family outer membrane protein [Mucilaginibacter oryzae]